MDNRKWIKRKYPKSFSIINEMLDDEHVYIFKNKRYSFGKLVNSITVNTLYFAKGTFIIFKKINRHNPPLYNIILKLKVKDSEENSYCSIESNGDVFKEIKK